ncbi:hypothetical protein [Actinomycetospora callitridis]|nr:hypothetical protein [Actinomycetospora callitridis]MDD7920014.1 hypothetical protein [Actinomycetospora callitridis]
MLHVLLGLVFLAVLVHVLRRAAGPAAAVYTSPSPAGSSSSP